MRGVVCREPGSREVLAVAEIGDPKCGQGEVVVEVAAAGINRADLLQRAGHYPPPPGASELLGLECSGVVAEVGPDVSKWSRGDLVCALLGGGGYAERVAVPQGQLLPVPEGVDLFSAAALPEAACTVWSNVFMLAGLQPGEVLLAHGGAGGIGTMAIQLAHALGATVMCTAGTPAKLDRCRELGADVAISYVDEDFVEVVRRESGGHGADVILDNMGAKYLRRNLTALAVSGRLVVIGLQGGSKGELNLAELLGKRAAVLATSLRSRSAAEKAAIVASVRENVWPLVADGVVLPVIHAVVPLADAAEGHRLLEDGEALGKVLLRVGSE
jgi:putative PIG3 family NAD(P)H quinone oxidoreductase